MAVELVVGCARGLCEDHPESKKEPLLLRIQRCIGICPQQSAYVEDSKEVSKVIGEELQLEAAHVPYQSAPKLEHLAKRTVHKPHRELPSLIPSNAHTALHAAVLGPVPDLARCLVAAPVLLLAASLGDTDEVVRVLRGAQPKYTKCAYLGDVMQLAAVRSLSVAKRREIFKCLQQPDALQEDDQRIDTWNEVLVQLCVEVNTRLNERNGPAPGAGGGAVQHIELEWAPLRSMTPEVARKLLAGPSLLAAAHRGDRMRAKGLWDGTLACDQETPPIKFCKLCAGVGVQPHAIEELLLAMREGNPEHVISLLAGAGKLVNLAVVWQVVKAVLNELQPRPDDNDQAQAQAWATVERQYQVALNQLAMRLRQQVGQHHVAAAAPDAPNDALAMGVAWSLSCPSLLCDAMKDDTLAGMDGVMERAYNDVRKLKQGTGDALCVRLQSLPDANHELLVVQQDTHGRTPLHWAAALGMDDVVWRLLSLVKHNKRILGELLSLKDDHGRNLLHAAAHGGNATVLQHILDAVTELNKLQQGADGATAEQQQRQVAQVHRVLHVCSEDVDGCPPISIAARQGNVGCAEKLLEQLQTSAIDRAAVIKAVHEAVEYGQKLVLDQLFWHRLLRGVKLMDMLDDKRRTPLHVAARQPHLDVLNYLLHRAFRVGEDLHKILRHQCIDGESPLFVAAWHGHAKLLEKLLPSSDAQRLQPLQELLSTATINGTTLLMAAVGSGVPEVLQLVLNPLTAYPEELKSAAKFSTVNQEGWTVWHFIGRANGPVGLVDCSRIVEMLQMGGQQFRQMSVDVLWQSTQLHQMTPLLIAARQNQRALIEARLQHLEPDLVRSPGRLCAKLSRYQDAGGCTVLHHAVKNGMHDTVSYILPHLWAVGTPAPEVLQLVQQTDGFGRSALHWAAYLGNEGLVTHYLLSKKLVVVLLPVNDRVVVQLRIVYNQSTKDLFLAKTHDGTSTFMAAVASGQVQVTNVIYEGLQHYQQRVAVELSRCNQEGWNVFHFVGRCAAPQGADPSKMVDLLLSWVKLHKVAIKKALATTTNRQGWTPVMMAAANGHVQVVVKLLLAANYREMDVLGLLSCCDNNGQNIFHICAAMGYDGIVVAILRLLHSSCLHRLTDVLTAHQQRTPLTLADLAPMLVSLDHQQRSPITLAAQRPALLQHFMSMLLHAGSKQASVSRCLSNNHLGQDITARHVSRCVVSATEDGDLKLLRALIEGYDMLQKASANFVSPQQQQQHYILPPTTHMLFDAASRPALWVAVERCNTDGGYACAQLLLSCWVVESQGLGRSLKHELLKHTVFKQDENNRATVLHRAARLGSSKMVLLLLEVMKPCCALAKKLDSHDHNSWHSGALSGNEEVVKALHHFDQTMMFSMRDKNPSHTPEHYLNEPARSWWKKDMMNYDKILTSSTSCANAALVGGSVVASIAYQAMLQPPKGDAQGKFKVDSRNASAYFMLNTLAFFFATASIAIGAAMLLPQWSVKYIEDAESRLKTLIWMLVLLLLALCCSALGMVGTAFGTWQLGLVEPGFLVVAVGIGFYVLVPTIVIYAKFTRNTAAKWAKRALHLKPVKFLFCSTERKQYRDIDELAV